MKLPVSSRRLAEQKQTAPSVTAVVVIYFDDKPIHNFTRICIFIKPFRNEKVLTGLPKIALRK